MKTRQNIVALCYDKSGRLLSMGTNRYTKTHPVQAFYAKKTGLPEKIYMHAEIDALVKVHKGKPFRMVIIRKGKNGECLPSEPCRICKAAMRDYGVVQVDALECPDGYEMG